MKDVMKNVFNMTELYLYNGIGQKTIQYNRQANACQDQCLKRSYVSSLVCNYGSSPPLPSQHLELVASERRFDAYTLINILNQSHYALDLYCSRNGNYALERMVTRDI
jgi:hypothetical protein